MYKAIENMFSFELMALQSFPVILNNNYNFSALHWLNEGPEDRNGHVRHTKCLGQMFESMKSYWVRKTRIVHVTLGLC